MAEQRILDGLRREYDVHTAMLKEIRQIVGDEPFAEFYREQNLDPAQSHRLPGHIAQGMNHRISDPRARAAITQATLRLFPTSDAFRSPSPPARELDASGLLHLPRALEQWQLQELVAALRSLDIGAIEGTLEKLRVEDVVGAPHVLKLALAPGLLRLAGEFLRCAPTIVNIEAWWSPATGRENPPEQLHRDKDDFRACKFFMYLTDVSPEDGPHIYARGSADPEFVARLIEEKRSSLTVEQAFYMGYGGRQYAAENERLFADHLVQITGPAGTSFVTNSYGLHRGVPPARGRRGMLAITYARAAYPHRLRRFAGVALPDVPADCSNDPLTRHALRLLLA